MIVTRWRAIEMLDEREMLQGNSGTDRGLVTVVPEDLLLWLFG